MRIYVGNLSEETTRTDLRNLFAEYGQIGRVGLAKERPSGELRRCGLVEMTEEEEGRRAITALSGTMLKERPLKVREARMRAGRAQSGGNTKS